MSRQRECAPRHRMFDDLELYETSRFLRLIAKDGTYESRN